jgi:hypothetical protein
MLHQLRGNFCIFYRFHKGKDHFVLFFVQLLLVVVLVFEYHSIKDYQGFTFECIKNFGIESPFSEKEFNSGKEDDLIQRLFEAGEQHYRVKSVEIAEMAFPSVSCCPSSC